jgi:pilus assembly protein CpaE
MSRVVLIGADRVLEHQARVLLGDEVVTLSPASADVLLTRMVGLPRRPELVLIGNCVSGETAIQIARVIRQLSDVLAVQSDDLRVRENARSIGVAEFMGGDPELEDVEALLERSRKLALRVRTTGVAARTSPRGPGRIISVISPKGGVGKTTVACNLAVTLATPDERVVIVDLDLQFGDVSGTLGVDSRHSVVDAVSKSAARDEFVLRTMLTTHSAGVAVLGAPESPAAADNMDPHRIGHLLRQLAADFDYVIVDTSPGLTEATLAAIEQSEAVVAVGGLDMSSARGLRKSLDLLKELQMLPRTVQLVFNGVDKQVGLTVEDAERIVGTAADVIVPRRKAVAVAGNHALPVVEVSPRDPASKALRVLAQELRAQLTLKDWRGSAPRAARKLAGTSRAAHATVRPTLDLQAIDDIQKETAS